MKQVSRLDLALEFRKRTRQMFPTMSPEEQNVLANAALTDRLNQADHFVNLLKTVKLFTRPIEEAN